MRTLTLELPDDMYEFALQEAHRAGTSLDAAIASLLHETWVERRIEEGLKKAEGTPSRPWREAMADIKDRFGAGLTQS